MTMPLITSDTIRDISVKSVEMFLNDKVPLSEGLAKQASALELNSEQIQRAVEATNSIAYLKVLELSNDRTVEFPLCKYAEVMAGIVMPEMDKQASINSVDQGHSSKETSVEQFVPNALNEREQMVHMIKMASIISRELEQLKDRAITIVPELEKVSAAIQADPQGIEKLATISEGKEFKILSALVYGEAKEYTEEGIFKSAELKEVENIASLYKEAKSIQESIKEKEALLNRSEHVKQASVIGAIGSAIGKGIGSVASIPGKALGGAIKNTSDNISSRVKATAVSAENFLTGSNHPIPSVTKVKGVGSLAKATGLTALDATMYQPGKSKTGTSKDVWDALQRS